MMQVVTPKAQRNAVFASRAVRAAQTLRARSALALSTVLVAAASSAASAQTLNVTEFDTTLKTAMTSASTSATNIGCSAASVVFAGPLVTYIAGVLILFSVVGAGITFFTANRNGTPPSKVLLTIIVLVILVSLITAIVTKFMSCPA